MSLFDFSSYSLWVDLAVFTAAGVMVWLAGTRLSRYVDEISERTGAGRAFLGALLLGGVTSLPEVATTITAALAQDPELAVNNVFGSMVMNVALLALVGDVTAGSRALTSLVDKSTLIMQGTLSILVIAVAAGAVMFGGSEVWGVGVGSAVVFVVAVAAFYLTHRFQDIQRWKPAGAAAQEEETNGSVSFESPDPPPEDAGPYEFRARAYEARAEAHRQLARANEELAEAQRVQGRKEPERDAEAEEKGEQTDAERLREEVRRLSTGRIVGYTVAAALVILVAGYFLARTGSSIASQTGLGKSFVGAILVAFATSLPEISTMISAVRLGAYSLVFSEIFGTNIFNATILFYTDLAYGGAPVLQTVGSFSVFAALLGVVLTAVYVVGLITRSRRNAVWRLGLDSIVVLILYFLGVATLYTLR